MIKEITVPEYLTGIRQTKKAYPKDVNIIAVDTETVNGKPYTLQITNNDNQPNLFYVNEKDITDTFIRLLKVLYNKKSTNVLFCHNLSFDLPILFYPYLDRFEKNEFAIVDEKLEYAVNIYCAKTWFAELIFLKKINNKDYSITFMDDTEDFQTIKGFKKSNVIKIVDSGNFIHGSLMSLASAKQLNLNHKKMKSPKGLGEQYLSDQYFTDYALNDVLAEYDLADYIIKMHKEYNIPPTISIAQMAQYVFTKNFMGDDTIMMPFKKILKWCELSYHGGKNGFYMEKPCKIKDVYDIDVNSMYPYAMALLPPMTSGEYKQTYEVSPDYEGVYCITGYANKCKYPIIPDHEFKYIVDAPVKNNWITSYELKEAMYHNEVKLDKLFGYIWIPNEDSKNPLYNYVQHFFEMKKNTPKSDSRYMMYKLLLNGIYGKFIQNIRYDTKKEYTYDEDNKKIKEITPLFEAGGLYNPFIGTLITGFARAYLHRLEHKYNALDSSTDSVKTIINPLNECNKELGGISVKCFGNCIFLRNKLYIHYNRLPNPEVPISYALHGFHGHLKDLLYLWLNKKQDYKMKRMTKVKESLKRKSKPLTPLMMHEFDRKLDISPDQFSPDEEDALEYDKLLKEGMVNDGETPL
jgi:hypothetical protein